MLKLNNDKFTGIIDQAKRVIEDRSFIWDFVTYANQIQDYLINKYYQPAVQTYDRQTKPDTIVHYGYDDY